MGFAIYVVSLVTAGNLLYDVYIGTQLAIIDYGFLFGFGLLHIWWFYTWWRNKKDE